MSTCMHSPSHPSVVRAIAYLHCSAQPRLTPVATIAHSGVGGGGNGGCGNRGGRGGGSGGGGDSGGGGERVRGSDEAGFGGSSVPWH